MTKQIIASFDFKLYLFTLCIILRNTIECNLTSFYHKQIKKGHIVRFHDLLCHFYINI